MGGFRLLSTVFVICGSRLEQRAGGKFFLIQVYMARFHTRDQHGSHHHQPLSTSQPARYPMICCMHIPEYPSGCLRSKAFAILHHSLFVSRFLFFVPRLSSAMSVNCLNRQQMTPQQPPPAPVPARRQLQLQFFLLCTWSRLFPNNFDEHGCLFESSAVA